MICPDCIKKDNDRKKQQIESAIELARKEAKKAGFTAFAIVERINGSGYMYRELTSPDIGRLKVEGYYIVD